MDEAELSIETHIFLDKVDFQIRNAK